MTRIKYNVSVNIVEKLASVCFKLLGKTHEHRKYFILLPTPILPMHFMFSAHVHNLAQDDCRQAAAVLMPWHGAL